MKQITIAAAATLMLLTGGAQAADVEIAITCEHQRIVSESGGGECKRGGQRSAEALTNVHSFFSLVYFSSHCIAGTALSSHS